MTENPTDHTAPDDSASDLGAQEPVPEPAADAKPGVNDPDPADTGTDEPLTSM